MCLGDRFPDVTRDCRGRPPAACRPKSVAEQLLAELSDLQAGLLVMGGHRRPLLQEILLGSVTKSILNAPTYPVFMYH